jgi:hypothetical protein
MVIRWRAGISRSLVISHIAYQLGRGLDDKGAMLVMISAAIETGFSNTCGICKIEDGKIGRELRGFCFVVPTREVSREGFRLGQLVA